MMAEGTLLSGDTAGAGADPKATDPKAGTAGTEGANTTADPKAGDPTAAAKAAEAAAAAAKEADKGKDGKEADKGKDGKEADKPAGPPEKYEFKLPDGVKVPDEVRGEYEGVFKELGLTQEQAQKLVDLQLKFEQKAAAETKAQWDQIHEGWISSFKADKEIGGDDKAQKETLALAKKALASDFATPGLAEALELTGAGNNPEVIRFLRRVGQAISDDRFVAGTTSPAGAKGSVSAKDFYNASGMK